MNPELRRKLERKAARLERRLGLEPGGDLRTTSEVQADQLANPVSRAERVAESDPAGWRRDGKRLTVTERQLAAAGMLEVDEDDD
jgi:hypothetical protein